MPNIKTLYCRLDRNSVLLCSAQAGSRGGQCHRRGGEADASQAGLCIPNERWQETLPAPTFLSVCTHIYTDIRTISNCSPCLSQPGWFKRQKSNLPKNITIQKCLARQEGQCIIQMTVRVLYQSFMWISSSWLEKREEAGTVSVSFPVCNHTFQKLIISMETFWIKTQLPKHTHPPHSKSKWQQ